MKIPPLSHIILCGVPLTLHKDFSISSANGIEIELELMLG